ncbi:hypothetical protein [Methanoculleus horonobensis]|uniref:hypothetical protein n=1 Tax=Methanoculleus horonobensis TaxID=528314 RepID=UPI000A643DC9|nr:hypothetical protein [Methanoculleus horonobensis]
MNRKKILTFILVFGTLSLISAISYLVDVWEEGAKSGYAQVVFMIGVVLGIIASLALTRIEPWITERYNGQE